MTKKFWDFVTRRSVGNRKRDGDISQAPEFKRLVEVQREMNDDEKIRTNQYLEEEMKEDIGSKTKRRFYHG